MQDRNRAEVLRVNAWPAHVLQRMEREVSVFRHPIVKEFQLNLHLWSRPDMPGTKRITGRTDYRLHDRSFVKNAK